MPTDTPDPNDPPFIWKLPHDVQVNILTYLRAYDLAAMQQTCNFYRNPYLVHEIVVHFAEAVYPEEYTKGFAQEAVSLPKKQKAGGKVPSTTQVIPDLYIYENLRNMEILVVARVLNSPEPATGFFVSKSWCKTALRWLEIQQEPSPPQKKLSKKKQRMRDRKLSDASPPWPNANIDILCEHQNLSCCSNSKSARARRRLLDRRAWKILKKLYPDSTQLPAERGECIQCTMETETTKKSEADRLEQEKLERKRPLANDHIRRFYTRRSGVPAQAVSSTASLGVCPLVPGTYYVLSRSWCYAWRRYIKTGENGFPSPPDASDLLCHAHRLPLLPPHLDAYLQGDSPELLAAYPTKGIDSEHTSTAVPPAAIPPVAAFVPGQGPDPEVLQAMRAAGYHDSPTGVGRQLSILREMEDIRRALPPAPPPPEPSTTVASRNELLDRENHAVVEILDKQEYLALQKEWNGHGFCISFTVDTRTRQPAFNTAQICHECDATGRQHNLHIKNRRRSVLRKSADKARAPASLEY